MTSHERHVVSNHLSFNCLFNSLCRSSSNKHQSRHYWPFVRGIHRWPVNSRHKWPVTRKMIPSDDVIMTRTKPWVNLTLMFELWKKHVFRISVYPRWVSDVNTNPFSHFVSQFYSEIPEHQALTHCGLVTPYGDIDLGQHWVRSWLVVWRHQVPP